jgi:hypothetical protein
MSDPIEYIMLVLKKHDNSELESIVFPSTTIIRGFKHQAWASEMSIADVFSAYVDHHKYTVIIYNNMKMKLVHARKVTIKVNEEEKRSDPFEPHKGKIADDPLYKLALRASVAGALNASTAPQLLVSAIYSTLCEYRARGEAAFTIPENWLTRLAEGREPNAGYQPIHGDSESLPPGPE